MVRRLRPSPPSRKTLVRLLLTAINCPKGKVETNLARHHELLALGKDSGCDLVLLPEMSLTGYLPNAAILLTDRSVSELVEATAAGPTLCFGLAEQGEPGAAPYITQRWPATGTSLDRPSARCGEWDRPTPRSLSTASTRSTSAVRPGER